MDERGHERERRSLAQGDVPEGEPHSSWMAPSSDLERPEKILVICAGSRGDVQPYIAVVKALRAAGYTNTLLGTCLDHEAIVKECGVPFYGIFGPCESFLRENEAARKGTAEGSMAKFAQAVAEATVGYAELHATNFNRVMREFQPDLLISGSLVESCGFMGLLRYQVPMFFVYPIHMMPNPKRMPFGLPNLPFKLNSWLMQAVLMEGLWTGLKKADALGYPIAGYRITDIITKQLLVDEADRPDMVPRLLLMSREWLEVMYPGCDAAVVPVGHAVLSAEFQEEVGSGEPLSSFGNSAVLQSIRAFLAAENDKPIVMGWGSMTCKSQGYMVELVISAVRLVGCRAIVQAGWAKLSLEALRSVAKDQGLIEYAEKNVLFIETAPHGWLFPQCACAVHHGGSGTVAASLRAGTPTVITPIFMDQFDYSYMVDQLGVGVGFKKQFQRISAKELADAIRTCLTSTSVHTKAREMSLTLRSQDGARRVVEYLAEFWADHVRTGRQLFMAQKFQEKLKARKKRCCGDGCACFPRPQELSNS